MTVDTRFGGRQPTPGQAGCATYGRIFGSVGGFDRHRNRADDPSLTSERDRCIDPATLGMVERDGIWRTPMSDEDRARMARLGSQVTPQTAERVSGDHPDTEEG